MTDPSVTNWYIYWRQTELKLVRCTTWFDHGHDTREGFGDRDADYYNERVGEVSNLL